MFWFDSGVGDVLMLHCVGSCFIITLFTVFISQELIIMCVIRDGVSNHVWFGCGVMT